jgi:hypothetical protein
MAWIVSASAAARKSFAACVKPSSSAFHAKAKYRLFAWDSPANADFKFSIVFAISKSPEKYYSLGQ